MRTIHSADPSQYNCKVCTFQTIHKDSLNFHIKSFHSADQPQYKCKVCPFQTKYQRSLNAHVKNIHQNSSQNQ